MVGCVGFAFIRESKKEALLIFIARDKVKEKIDLTDYGYKVVKTIYGVEASGSKISITTKGPASAIWRLK